MANRYDILEAYYKFAIDYYMQDIAERVENMGFQPVDCWEAQSTNEAKEIARALHYSEALTDEGSKIYEAIVEKQAKIIARLPARMITFYAKETIKRIRSEASSDSI
tara:strand:- start:647 stop:967 length:321 start_codon:yes stop_codon:yes gene_type:complete